MAHLAKDVRRVSSSDGSIVMHLRRGTMFRINPVGSKILDLLEREVSVGEIAEQISREFGVAREMVRADVRDFLACLEAHGVVDFQPGES